MMSSISDDLKKFVTLCNEYIDECDRTSEAIYTNLGAILSGTQKPMACETKSCGKQTKNLKLVQLFWICDECHKKVLAQQNLIGESSNDD